MIIVDGSNLLHRYLSIPQYTEKRDSHDRPTGGIEAVIRSIFHIQAVFGFEKGVCICWDLGIPKFRREIFPAYKEHKKETEHVGKLIPRNPYDYVEDDSQTDDERKQRGYTFNRAILNDILPSLGCVSLMMEDCEADDIISVLTRLLFLKDDNTIIVSRDHDFEQLLMPGVRLWDAGDKSFKTERDVIRKYELDEDRWVRQWLIRKALMGDKSDGVPGIRGIGAKISLHIAKAACRHPLQSMEDCLDGIKDIERPSRFSETNFQSLQEKVHTNVQRNVNLIDLRYGLDNRIPLYKEIFRRLWFSSSVSPDYNYASRRLMELEIDNTSGFEPATILESNQKADVGNSVKRAVEGSKGFFGE